MSRIQLLACFWFVRVNADIMSSHLSNCGVSQGCWLIPPGCEQSTGPNCVGIVSWIVTSSGIRFSVITSIADLLDSYIIKKSVYGAIGFSLDSYMGNDTVVVCAINSTGQGAVFVNWNDQNWSEKQFKASDVMITNKQVSLVGDRMNCEFEWIFAQLDSLPPAEKLCIFNLSDPNLKLHILFARGPANWNTLQIEGHAMTDGLLFPFVSTETTGFCPSGCGHPDGMEWIIQMHQAFVPQSLKQKLVIIHATLMLLVFLVILPTIIMSIRFGKTNVMQWSRFIWLQVHQIGSMASFLTVLVSVVCILYEAEFHLIECSQRCDSISLFRHSHSLMGIYILSVFCVHILGSIIRPVFNSDQLLLWNFLHLFLGYGIWFLGCVSCLIGIGLPKTGLVTYYNYLPQQIMGISMIIALVCFVLCEWIVNRKNFLSMDPNQVENFQSSTTGFPMNEVENEFPPNFPSILIGFNAISGLVITLTLHIMLKNSAKAIGFDI